MLAALPVWVPFLFLGLVLLGYRLSRPRTVRPAALMALALAMLGLSLYGIVGAFGATPLALLLWAAGYAVAVVLGARQLGSHGMTAVGHAVRVPGSWVPMALLMAIFAAKFVLGFAAGMRSPLLHDSGFIAAMSTALGALSGGFGARAVAVHRYAATARSAAQGAGFASA